MRYSLWTWQSLYREGGNFTQNSHKADWTDCSIFLELQICISPGFPFFSSRTWQPSWEGAVMVKPGLNRERWTSLWLASFPDIQHTHLPLHCHEQTTNTVQYIVGQIFNTYTMYMKCSPSSWIEGRKKISLHHHHPSRRAENRESVQGSFYSVGSWHLREKTTFEHSTTHLFQGKF